MKYECPEYAKTFRCKGGTCSDNCCIGWEIGIDEETKAVYDACPGELGKKIRKNLDTGVGYATFKLCENGRCPMLDGDNLCEIIKAAGDGFLSEICREHPRYYNVLPDKTEWGVGLACEEAARLILECDAWTKYTEEREGVLSSECDAELYAFLSFARDRIFEIFDTSPFSFSEKLKSALFYAEALSDAAERKEYGEIYPFIPLYNSEILDTDADFMVSAAFSDILSELCTLDFLDLGFKERLELLAKESALSPLPSPDEFSEARLSRVMKYFIHRYFITSVFDREPVAKIKLAVVLTLTLHALTKNSHDNAAWICAAKSLSKETEYNEDNLNSILDMTYTESAFSTKSLLQMLF